MTGSPRKDGFGPNANEPRLWIAGDIPLREYVVRVEFDRAATGDLAADLAGNFRHRLLDFLPEVSVNAAGRVELRLIVPGPDLWTSVLTAMSVVTQAGYEPVAVQVRSDDAADLAHRRVSAATSTPAGTASGRGARAESASPGIYPRLGIRVPDDVAAMTC